jgi:hypothetical protein
MTKLAVCLTTFAFALSPAFGVAQSALPDPAIPGSGYKVPETPRTTRTPEEPPAALTTDQSKPGSGYQIPDAPRAGDQPLSGLANPAVPGSGYQIEEESKAPRK